MKASLKEVLEWAEARTCAVGAFNTPTWENVRAVISAAERLGAPVIISHAQIHEKEGAPLDEIGPLMVWAAERAKVPVCAFLDHGETVDYVKRAIDLGFGGAMFDGSLSPYDVNVAGTREVVAYAHARGCDVEAEIGALAQREGGGGEGKAVYTDPDLALRFAKDTGIDALAASFGTAHGIYREKPRLDFDRIRRIRELTGLPLVMHGGSGVSPEDYRTAIGCGVRKINYYSYMARAGRNAVEAKLAAGDVTFFHVLAAAATEAMSADAERAMRVFRASTDFVSGVAR